MTVQAELAAIPKTPKPPKRCLWVWKDPQGWHQCERPRDDHEHTVPPEIPNAIRLHPHRGDGQCCLGVNVVHRPEVPPLPMPRHPPPYEPLRPDPFPWLYQCHRLRGSCLPFDHEFFAVTRLEEGA